MRPAGYRADLCTWWLGATASLLHGLFLLVRSLPLLPYIHLRMTFEGVGASAVRDLEPSGFVGMNDCYRAPLTVLEGRSSGPCWAACPR
jgi:hypothetical protein